MITESVDKDAKIIFGTIHDDRLKKGEVKVTVIASGFPEGTFKKAVFHTPEVKQVPIIEKEMPIEKVRQTKYETPKTPVVGVGKEPPKEEDDWSSIPAFLRRGKK